MKIALIGYGKMGHIIEDIARQRGHEITAVIDLHNKEDLNSEGFRKADVAIEFTVPASAEENVLKCFEAGVPVVCGTTGWNSRLPEMKKLCDEGKGTLLQTSNFSVGVNIFKMINRRLAGIMNHFPQYHPSMLEIHHIHKLDHPSGTAVTLAEEIVSATDCITSWEETVDAQSDSMNLHEENVLKIKAEREGEVPGIHTVKWESPQDIITLTHSAKSREGFALGAVLAAEWLAPLKGWHTIEEMYDKIS